jgi:hypothetical protein
MTQNVIVYNHSVHIFSNKNRTESNAYTFVCFKNFALLYRRVGAGATEAGAGTHQNFYPELELELHTNVWLMAKFRQAFDEISYPPYW